MNHIAATLIERPSKYKKMGLLTMSIMRSRIMIMKIMTQQMLSYISSSMN
jgi:hypothetical protein